MLTRMVELYGLIQALMHHKPRQMLNKEDFNNALPGSSAVSSADDVNNHSKSNKSKALSKRCQVLTRMVLLLTIIAL